MMYFHDATFEDRWNLERDETLYEPWMSVTRFDQQRPTRRTHVGSKQIDQETGYCKTWIHLARRMVKHFENKKTRSEKPQVNAQK